VRRRPYSVLLFDEIEKAHKDVFNVLLQILDDGRLTDGQGRTVNFTNTVIIMTSNIGSEFIKDVAGKDEEVTEKVFAALKAHFPPEFINRVDDLVVFHSLKKEQIASIVEIQLGKLESMLAKRKLSVKLTDAAKMFLADHGWDPLYGARPLKRAIQKYVQDPLSTAILEGKFPEGSTIKVDARDGGLAFN